MAGSVNKVILVGNLGRDPEVRSSQDGTKIVNLSIATSERWKDRMSGEPRERTEWHRVVLFGKVAEIAGDDLWAPIWAALHDDADPAAQEAAVAAGLGAVREHVEAMPAAERADKLPALMGLGPAAWRLHTLISG